MQFLKNMSPFQRVITGLVLGIFAGLFFGETLAPLKIAGDVYIRLLQMTVIPYILVSIIAGLGRLDAHMAGNIGIKGGMVVVFLWLATMLGVVMIPLAYPEWESAGFFSTSLLADRAEFDFIRLYIPYNVFYSLAETIVPAVVVFSIMMGLALITVSDKAPLLSVADTVAAALMRIASTVAKVAPFGVFAISAAAAGTIYPEELTRLQVFLWTYLAAWTVLAIVALPLFVAWGTPFKYRRVLSIASEAMVTAIATGTVLVVLPLIIERCKEMLREEGLENEQTLSTVDVMVPTAYSFPSAGTLMGLGFILFSAWYLGAPLGIDQYASYIIMGTLAAFGSMAVAIPFMLDFFNLPEDQFQLYLLGSVVTARFATGMAALHGFVVTLMVASAIMGKLNWRKVMQALGISLGAMAATMLSLGAILQWAIPYSYEMDNSFISMVASTDRVEVVKTENPAKLGPQQLAQSRMVVMLERGTIRVGYTANRLPLAFRNKHGNVVGYDMDLVHSLAADVGLKLEVYRVETNQLVPWLLDGRLDIVVGGWSITPTRALSVDFSQAYLKHNLGFIIADHKRDQFGSVRQLRQAENLRIGFPVADYYAGPLKTLFPNAELIKMASPRDFLRGETDNIDAVVFSAEWGSAWTLLYPNFAAVVPEGMRMVVPMGIGLPLGQFEMKRFIDTWLSLKADNGFHDDLYNYWILGQSRDERPPRWSILNDVLLTETEAQAEEPALTEE
jgi:Na+/H+-dicarboxylate symporter